MSAFDLSPAIAHQNALIQATIANHSNGVMVSLSPFLPHRKQLWQTQTLSLSVRNIGVMV
jgi:hypothetical protein